jgi:hypothetical protein
MRHLLPQAGNDFLGVATVLHDLGRSVAQLVGLVERDSAAHRSLVRDVAQALGLDLREFAA